MNLSHAIDGEAQNPTRVLRDPVVDLGGRNPVAIGDFWRERHAVGLLRQILDVGRPEDAGGVAASEVVESVAPNLIEREYAMDVDGVQRPRQREYVEFGAAHEVAGRIGLVELRRVDE